MLEDATGAQLKSRSGGRAEGAVDVEEHDDPLADLADAGDEGGVHGGAEGGGRLNLIGRDVLNLADHVDDHAHDHWGGTLDGGLHLNDHDAGALGVVATIQAEATAEVDDRDHPTAQIQDTAHLVGHAWHRRDVLEADDFLDLEDRHAVVLLGEHHGQVLVRSRTTAAGRGGGGGHGLLLGGAAQGGFRTERQGDGGGDVDDQAGSAIGSDGGTPDARDGWEASADVLEDDLETAKDRIDRQGTAAVTVLDHHHQGAAGVVAQVVLEQVREGHEGLERGLARGL